MKIFLLILWPVAAALILALLFGCTQVTITGNHNTVSVTTMVNGNSATIPVSPAPGIP